jgi:2-polyprenyl-3-methyl-5-hydroxy-6-metoxy-1,4-benzoquinol methylase
LTITEEKDLTRITALSVNSVLKTYSEVIEAKRQLKELKLFLHHDPVKSWDTYRMIEKINKAHRDSFVLDVGCNDSPILPMLRRLGFSNLYGCDLHLMPRFKHKSVNTLYSLFKKEYRPIIHMHRDKPLKLSIQNLENTNYQDNIFDFVTSLSVIEHGVDIQKYFKEMSRIIKKGGSLLTSTDYWPVKTTNTKCVLSKGTPDKVFDRNEIEDLIVIADKAGLKLVEPVDFTYIDKVVHWKRTGLDYTFIFLAMKKE